MGDSAAREGRDGDNGEAKSRAAEHLIPRRSFGRTGLSVGIFGLGGAIAVAEGRERAEEIVERAIDLGVNYIDTAHQYGPSESNIGGVMARRRAEVILASKTDDRTYDGTMRQLEESLTRLRTEYLDVYQLHAIHTEADLRTALSERGAL
ncbi:MAG: aldo/keto reductase, partial [Spirochaetaceae bacterium]